MRLTFFLPIALNLYLQRQATEEGNKPKEDDAIAWMVVIKYLKSSDLLLQTSFSDLGDHIFETKRSRVSPSWIDKIQRYP